ncbi:integral membrane [Pyrenophora seminiperda CCB06]|uniref:Integral membrane n=1 Tax=Pyrenophora seminiperda CCB06 TaxID=1302712 RepID=A0A3M7M0I7_9PLEO|nr:integral membrane [Pyrenophora seminiperda CCB06]
MSSKQEAFATQILYIIVLLASKLSVLFLYLRLSPGGPHRLATWSLTALSGVWALASIILIATPCNMIQAYTKFDDCANRWPKWQAIAAMDILTEGLIFIIAIQLVYSLHMRFLTKFMVVMAFSARLPVIAIAGVRLYYMNEHIRGTSYTFEYIIATQWQMGYAIMSSTLTGMAPFLRPFDSSYVASFKHSDQSTSNGHTAPVGSMGSSVPPLRRRKTSSGGQSESYLMETLPSRRGSKQTLPEHRSSLDNTRPISSSQAPHSALTVADEHFCPVHKNSGHETEVWVGERSLSMTLQEMMQASSSGTKKQKLVIGKKEEFKIEVDRASHNF